MASSSEAVKKWRRRTRKKLVDHLGGKCVRCGWIGHSAAFDFHHLSDKDFTLSKGMSSPVKFEKLLVEAEKCILLCAICHRIEHAGPDYDSEMDGPLEELSPEFTCMTCGREKMNSLAIRCGRCSNDFTRKGNYPETFQEVMDDVARLGVRGAGDLYGVSGPAVSQMLKRAKTRGFLRESTA